MPAVEVDGITVAYEEMGTGEAIVWTPGGFAPRNPFAYCFAIRDCPSEWHMWCDALHGLFSNLGILPAYFGGGSAGAVLSLLMAHLHPGEVKGIMLHAPPDVNNDWGKEAVRAWYYVLAEAAERGGMTEVLRYSETPPSRDWAWASGRVAENAHANPESRTRILAADPAFFARVMRRWGDWALAGGLHRANLSKDELSRIRVPAIVGPGRDGLGEKWSQEVVEKHLEDSPPTALWLYLPFYQEFLAQRGE